RAGHSRPWQDGGMRLLPLLLACGCATTLSARAQKVRDAVPDEVAGCRLIGDVSGSSLQTGIAVIEQGKKNAMNEAREKAAQIGATHVVGLTAEWGFMATTAHGIAYNCEEKRPPPQLAAGAKRPRVEQGRVAVLDFHGKSSGLDVEQMRYFGDVV